MSKTIRSPDEPWLGLLGEARAVKNILMRSGLLPSIALAGLLYVSPVQVAAAVPGPVPVVSMMASPSGGLLKKVYYYRRRYYPYRYHGMYYGHRYYRYGRWHYY
jgi:hypothetical protein